jgi:periplasmic protein TonB
MSPKPEKVSGEVCKESLGSLSGCLVDGDAEQLALERRTRRRALAVSIGLQSAVLATLILVPVFSKAERIGLKIITPVPPYRRLGDVSRNSGAQPRPPRGPQNQCRFCAPPSIPTTIARHDRPSSASSTDNAPPGIGERIPGVIDGLIPLSEPRQRVLPPPETEHHVVRPQVIRMTQLDPAMLIHRVEPAYPNLARQTHRDGRVELRAIIGTDGTIQSLQIVVSDPLFDRSALEAVGQWRYKPTILNGQPVEIETYITVIYSTQH